MHMYISFWNGLGDMPRLVKIGQLKLVRSLSCFPYASRSKFHVAVQIAFPPCPMLSILNVVCTLAYAQAAAMPNDSH